MTSNFDYRQDHPLDDDVLTCARNELVAPTSDAAYKEAFRTLLHSGHTASICIALDHYHYADTMRRHGLDNTLDIYAPEVLERARELLRQPPLAVGEQGAREVGANHASALSAMLSVATPEDAELIAEAIETGGGLVRDAAIMAAGASLERSSEPKQRLIDALSAVVLDHSRSTRERTRALLALDHARSQDVIRIAIKAMRADDLALQVYAALVLADRDLDTHRASIEQLVATWPPDAPYPASEVRDIIQGHHGT